MTWRLKPNSPNTLRAIEVLRTAERPLTCQEVAHRLGLSATVARRHLAVARSAGAAALLGNGTNGTSWATPEVAAAKRAEAAQAKRERAEAARARRRALQRLSRGATEVQRWADHGTPTQLRRSTWPTPAAAPAPTSVFHLGLGLERRVCTYCRREGHLADACPRREQER